GMILVPSAAVSRRHLSIARRGGEVWIRDLGSHNGTTLRGAPMTGEVAVGDGIELWLGNEVPLVVRLVGEGPDEGPRAIAIEVAGVRYVAPLGPARLGLGAWRLEWSRGTASVEGRDEARDEAWVELATDDRSPVYAGGLRLAGRGTLLVGDATPNEGRAVQRLLARDALAPLPEPLLLAVASALADRGETVAAAGILRRTDSLPALMTRADLLERAGDRSVALSLVERVLGRDVDWPGARERRARWSAALGREGAGAASAEGAAGLNSRDASGGLVAIGPLAPLAPFVLLREAGRG